MLYRLVSWCRRFGVVIPTREPAFGRRCRCLRAVWCSDLNVVAGCTFLARKQPASVWPRVIYSQRGILSSSVAGQLVTGCYLFGHIALQTEELETALAKVRRLPGDSFLGCVSLAICLGCRFHRWRPTTNQRCAVSGNAS